MFCGVLKYVYETQLLYVFNINYQNTVFFFLNDEKGRFRWHTLYIINQNLKEINSTLLSILYKGKCSAPILSSHY